MLGLKDQGVVFRGKKVLVTGHTGFKGGWLSLWLKELGAKVYGFALAPIHPSLYDSAKLGDLFEEDIRGDVTDFQHFSKSVQRISPEVIFHLAAQPLVKTGYSDPLLTFGTNITGTVNLMQAITMTESVKVVLIVSTDKVYENKDWIYPYRETDVLGGSDPYSASKVGAELVVGAFRESYFRHKNQSVSVVSVRAGNVIGGGDWSEHRLVADCMRAFSNNNAVELRQPGSVRPWQHVLEPLSGYLMLAQHLMEKSNRTRDLTAINFGPAQESHISAKALASKLATLWGGGANVKLSDSYNSEEKESVRLHLDSSLASSYLGWGPVWSIDAALKKTVEWYQRYYQGDDMRSFTVDQLTDYVDAIWQSKA